MQKSDFEKLSLQNKVILLFENGEELFIRHSQGFTIKLYQLEDFFCEIWYSSEANKIYHIKTVDVKDVASSYNINIDIHKIIDN